jgi:hypothetical protein
MDITNSGEKKKMYTRNFLNIGKTIGFLVETSEKIKEQDACV